MIDRSSAADDFSGANGLWGEWCLVSRGNLIREKIQMAKSKVFFSFHFDGDAWRTQTVRNIGAIEGSVPVKPNDWETVKRGGDAAIEKWIDDQLKGKDCLMVLVGTETSNRKWVKREIAKAWDGKIGVMGIRIHKLLDQDSKSSKAGGNPFEEISLTNGAKLSQYVSLYDPAGADSKEVYASISNNLQKWIDAAVANKRT